MTAGHPANSGAGVEVVLGLPQSMETVSCCFGCHATGFVAPAELQAMLPGVSCERRHGAGGATLPHRGWGSPGRF